MLQCYVGHGIDVSDCLHFNNYSNNKTTSYKDLITKNPVVMILLLTLLMIILMCEHPLSLASGQHYANKECTTVLTGKAKGSVKFS